ncbi:protein shisa-9-like [Protopterus annectens]|uniref:protein shisa-9-like n=1 Tax=Protopterus annectens TaxID=7888 RepID=UPI001CFAD515|nr:protein shisa-9-like [Protopterus annectens]
MPIHASRTIERDMGVERTTHRTTYGSRGSTNAVHTLNHCALADNITRDTSDWCSGRRRAEKVNEDFYAKRRHLAELAAKGSLPLHPMRPQRHEDGPYSLDRNSSKINGEKSRIAKMHSQPQVYNITYRTWDPTDQSLRRQVDTNRKHGTLEPPVSDRFGARSQHYLPPHPYFVTNSKTEVTV